MDAKKPPTPDEIARLITEDVGYNNGLVTETNLGLPPGMKKPETHLGPWEYRSADSGWYFHPSEDKPYAYPQQDALLKSFLSVVDDRIKQHGTKFFTGTSKAPTELARLRDNLSRQHLDMKDLEMLQKILIDTNGQNEARQTADIEQILNVMKREQGERERTTGQETTKKKEDVKLYKLYAARQGVGEDGT